MRWDDEHHDHDSIILSKFGINDVGGIVHIISSWMHHDHKVILTSECQVWSLEGTG